MKTFLRNALFDVRIWLLLFFLQIPSLRAMFKYLPLAPVLAPVLLFGAFLAYALALHDTPLGRRLRRIADNYIISVVILLLCCGLNALIYPYADSLKYQGGGSTADDVLIASIHALLAGKDLYDIPVTASPGPGWILLNARIFLW